MIAGSGVTGEPAHVAVLVQVPCVIERYGLEEDADGAVQRGSRQAGAKHRRRVIGPGRGRDDQARNIPQDPDRVVIMEVPAEPLLVAETRDPHHQRIAELPGREELERGRLAADLVLSVVQVSKVLNLGYRQQSSEPAPESHAEDGLLIEQGVEYPGRPEASLQSLCHAVHAAFSGHVLAEHEHSGVPGE